MAGVCSDNRFEIIAKVKEHLIKATNIEMQPEELKQADNILFRLWQLGYFKQVDLETENKELKEVHESDKRSLRLIAEKGAELEKKISILLSCKNCPENKGGYICQKEYEDKCLAQKIHYIKELQEENKKWKDEWQEQVQKENDESYARTLQTIQLNKAKELIKNIIRVTWNEGWNYSLGVKAYAEQFLGELE